MEREISSAYYFVTTRKPISDFSLYIRSERPIWRRCPSRWRIGFQYNVFSLQSSGCRAAVVSSVHKSCNNIIIYYVYYKHNIKIRGAR